MFIYVINDHTVIIINKEYNIIHCMVTRLTISRLTVAIYTWEREEEEREL